MVVVKLYGDSFQCLPMYSHNGDGMSAAKYKDEYVDIRDVDAKHSAPVEGHNGCLLAYRSPDFEGNFVKGKTCVKLSEINTFRYETWATIEGQLEEPSVKLLLRLLDDL